MSKDENLYSDIDALIRTTDDAKDRAMILIMQRILMRVEKALADDAALQDRVLNGLVPYHKGDHELISSLRDLNVEDAIKWVNLVRTPEMDDVLDFAKSKMLDEQDSKKRFRRKIDDLLFEVGKAALWFILGAALFGVTVGYPFAHRVTG